MSSPTQAMSENDEHASIQQGYVIAMAASAGGLKVLIDILAPLPPDFPAPILIVKHLSPHHASFLVEILTSRTRLKVKSAEENDVLTPGVVYTAPPDWHMLIKPPGVLTLTQTERVHFVRPAANLLFTSVAQNFGSAVVAVVLTGSGVDGADGIRVVREKGGMVIAQDQATSEFYGMPGAAIKTGMVDHILALDEIAPYLENLPLRR